ncbi:MAG: hypothetical protein Q8S84_00980 [bacterium]|nr:hypothetical protein [bacterium]MDP3380151.1 hypothetical protein [bacterium]
MNINLKLFAIFSSVIDIATELFSMKDIIFTLSQHIFISHENGKNFSSMVFTVLKSSIDSTFIVFLEGHITLLYIFFLFLSLIKKSTHSGIALTISQLSSIESIGLFISSIFA